MTVPVAAKSGATNRWSAFSGALVASAPARNVSPRQSILDSEDASVGAELYRSSKPRWHRQVAASPGGATTEATPARASRAGRSFESSNPG